MDVSERIKATLPDSIEHVENDGPIEVAELWLMARAYSRLRHRSSPQRYPERRARFEKLKTHCIRLAIAREPETFLVFVDPENQQLLIVYHRVERTLLHLPCTRWHGCLENRDRVAPECNASLWSTEPGGLESLGAEGCRA